MIVMKFGGTSLGTAKDVRNVREIASAALARDPVLVVSAQAGVTNALLDLSERAPAGHTDISAVADRHRRVLAELELPTDLLDRELGDLQDLVRGMKLVGEASPRAIDYLLSLGELCSARTVAAFFSSAGLEARALHAGEIGLLTDSNFGRARPRPDVRRIGEAVAACGGLPVITGFLGQDSNGNVTTLGRNGSDLTATLIGDALSADEIQIWTDVDGVMTADPAIVDDARRIETMSFSEAAEVAYYGGRVLHPATLLPAMEKRIPVRVLNTSRPEAPGTVILADSNDAGPTVRAVVHRLGIHLISVVNPRMLQQPGYLARVFGIAGRHAIDIDLVATSEVSVTMTTDEAGDLRPFLDELADAGEISVESDCALLGVVGRGMARATGVASEVLGALADEGVRVRVISQGALKVNVALVVSRADVERAVRALHLRFFGS